MRGKIIKLKYISGLKTEIDLNDAFKLIVEAMVELDERIVAIESGAAEANERLPDAEI